MLYSDFLSLSLFFSVPKSHPWHHIAFSCHITLQAPLGCESFSDVPCFWWHFWGVLVKCFVKYPLVGICLIVFIWLDWSHGFGERKTTEVNAIFIISRLHTLHTTHQCWCWPWSLGQGVFVKLFYWKVTFFFLTPFLFCPFLRGSHYASHT